MQIILSSGRKNGFRWEYGLCVEWSYGRMEENKFERMYKCLSDNEVSEIAKLLFMRRRALSRGDEDLGGSRLP